MTHPSYRRHAILGRIRSALDAFYLLQKIDWEYDVRETLDQILAVAMREIEFDGGKEIEQALILVLEPGGQLEVRAGWKTGKDDVLFSHTIIEETVRKRAAVLCENAKVDPRFMDAESLKDIPVLSCIAVPLMIGEEVIGALYVESHSPQNIFAERDQEFLVEFSRAIAPYMKTALVHRRHVDTIQKLRSEMGERFRWEGIGGTIVGRSEAIQRALDLAQVAARGDRTILLTGESGTGKELLARAIHYMSPRRNDRFLVVDCSSLPETLLESELFGHARGAFTGAVFEKTGAFEEAGGGTVFLDEVSDAPKPLQQKLRRVIEEGEIRKVGDAAYRHVDVRVICATNKVLLEEVRQGHFIRDLYYRINQFPIHVPPLRERREDIPLLVDHFISSTASRRTPRVSRIGPGALRLLVARDWSENNVRELRNAVELAIDFAEGEVLDDETVRRVLTVQAGEGRPYSAGVEPSDAGGADIEPGSVVEVRREELRRMLRSAPEGAKPFYRIEKEMTRKVILEALRTTGWKLRPAARLLGLSPVKLREELRVFLKETLERSGEDLPAASGALGMPEKVLRRKMAELLGKE